MHICMVGVKGLPLPAGIDNVVEQLGSRLVQRGHRVTVFVRPHYTPRSQTEYKGMRLVHVPSIRSRSLDAITATFFASLLAIRQHPDIVHIHSQGLSVFAPLPRLFGIQTIVQSHGLDWQRAKWQGFAKRFLKMTDYTTVMFPNATTVVSQKLQQYYEGKYRRQVFYIPNGAPHPELRPPSEIHKLGLNGRDYILFAARLVPEKFGHGLIEAYRRLPDQPVKLVIAGDSNYGDEYATNLKKLASDRILFLGFVQGELLKELLSNAFLYTLPSEIEGLSTGLIEAMAYGNCVLVSDIAENIEVIGSQGLTFRSGNVEDLQAKLALTIGHPEMVEEFRQKAKDHILSLFNWEKVTDQYESLYQSLTGSH